MLIKIEIDLQLMAQKLVNRIGVPTTLKGVQEQEDNFLENFQTRDIYIALQRNQIYRYILLNLWCMIKASLNNVPIFYNIKNGKKRILLC